MNRISKIASRIVRDFKYPNVTRKLWRKIVGEAMKRQNVTFDLENDDTSGDPTLISVGEYKTRVKGEEVMKPCRFAVQMCYAAGDWQNPVLYYRCQYKEGDLYRDDLWSYDEDKCFAYIPVDGNALQKVKKGWTAYSAQSSDRIQCDEGKCKEDLVKFLSSLADKQRK